MHGLPHDFDPSVFVGLRISSVAFAENLISLVFDSSVTVVALGAIKYRLKAECEEIVETPPVARTSLVSLVGEVVVASYADSPRELILRFAGGGSLALADDSDIYESFIMTIRDREIVV